MVVLVVKNPPAIQETEEILVRYLAQEDPLVYSCLENAREKETWWTRVHRFPKIWTGLKQHFMLVESEEEQKSLLMKVKVENEKLA